MYIYVCIYICMYISLYIYIYIFTHIYIHTLTCAHTTSDGRQGRMLSDTLSELNLTTCLYIVWRQLHPRLRLDYLQAAGKTAISPVATVFCDPFLLQSLHTSILTGTVLLQPRQADTICFSLAKACKTKAKELELGEPGALLMLSCEIQAALA